MTYLALSHDCCGLVYSKEEEERVTSSTLATRGSHRDTRQVPPPLFLKLHSLFTHSQLIRDLRGDLKTLQPSSTSYNLSLS